MSLFSSFICFRSCSLCLASGDDAAVGVIGHHDHSSSSAAQNCIDCQYSETVNETLTLSDMTRCQLWIINDLSTICWYLRLARPWMVFIFSSIAKTHYACTYPEGLFSTPLPCNFSLQISFSLHSLNSNVLIWWSDRRVSAFSFSLRLMVWPPGCWWLVWWSQCGLKTKYSQKEEKIAQEKSWRY